ncbi:MAG: sulfite exporter TauE/SafE family protein [Mongoliibacter sp.]|uniref:sulfite exporter TauE/SafE family protein n=1 Tax=Mongoliibacter sp. TaxID=2022438 RepID=UPI0012F01ED1|nr:sulfite exporter TauE/SafE family protein [Mongoliibacter sp.]TVP50111.1 MAG: sulfite exporter TauE/SafE family protein [Mongoliibacter sp.]
MESFWWLLYILMPVAAFLYAAVGHGGASSYLMFLAIFNFAPEEIRPTALILNIIVSFMAFMAYRGTVKFPIKLFLSIIIFSVPAAFLGGKILVDTAVYKQILGILLFFPILRFLNVFPTASTQKASQNLLLTAVIGLSIGFVSGLIGIGGGIILSPILLLLGWANMKETAAVSALFIFFNSISGLIGASTFTVDLDPQLWILMPLTIAGGALGAYMGAKKFNYQGVKYTLTVVLLIAAVKLILG